ncbi:MAG TPA: asparagine synthase (glutamine-hydrolyzing) [Polyangiaceae bacterium]|nr:asparagine synthase (glutamine-hydrolyzing) [Polyangiaceae bacterium]
MCGVVAIIGQAQRWSEPERRRALDALAHRGPDGMGNYLSPDGRVWLGHTRLAVIAPQDGAQPVANEDGSIVASVNGELYGFASLRTELEAMGHRFLTQSDSELVVHLYEEYGLEAVRHLRGEFAFVLWDRARGRAVAARDRFGIKPLVYTEQAGSLLVASEAKALFALGFGAAWDRSSLEHAFAHQYLPPNRTLFRGVKQLPPGHLLIAECGTDGALGAVRIERYWDLDLPRTERAVDLEDAAEKLLSQLEQAVKLRLRADVPVAFHLSGGLDSASILALAAQHSSQRLHAFTVAFQHPPYAEGELARDLARELGVELHVVDVPQSALLEALPDAVFHGEGLCINGQLPSKLLLARAIRKAGFTVALSGEGADEALLGYAHLASDLVEAETVAPNDTHSAQVGVMLPSADAPDLPEVQARLGFVPTFLRAKAAFGRELLALTTEPDAGVAIRQRAFERLFESLGCEDQLSERAPVLQSAYLWTKLALAGYILRTLGDGTEMAASVEGRTPFLDHHFYEFVRELPVSAKIRMGTNGVTQKYLQRVALRKLLPEAVLTRTKQPFLAPPLTRFVSREARELVQDTLSDRALGEIPYLHVRRTRNFLERCFQSSDRTKNSDDAVLMTLLSACYLQQRFALTG